MPLNQSRQVHFLVVCAMKNIREQCNKGVGSNSIKCLVCGFWAHKPCSNIRGPLKPNPDFKYNKCRGEVSNATILYTDPIDINGKEIKKVRSFCYLCDFTGQRGGCFDATTARIKYEWKKVRELFSILICRGLSLKTRDYAYNAYVKE